MTCHTTPTELVRYLRSLPAFEAHDALNLPQEALDSISILCRLADFDWEPYADAGPWAVAELAARCLGLTLYY